MRIRRRRKSRVDKSPNWPCHLWCELATITNLFFYLPSVLILHLCCLSFFVLFLCFCVSIYTLFGTRSYPHSFILLSTSPIVTPFDAFDSSYAFQFSPSHTSIRIIFRNLWYSITYLFWWFLSISHCWSVLVRFYLRFTLQIFPSTCLEHLRLLILHTFLGLFSKPQTKADFRHTSFLKP